MTELREPDPMRPLPRLPELEEAGDLLRRRVLSPVELTQACLERIERWNPVVNAFITVTAEQALIEAREAEHEIAAGHWRGPLHGVPLALKDLIDTRGVRTTAASAVFQDRIPDEDAEVVRRLKQAGAVLLGKLNLHEFAYGGTCVPSQFGAVRNPWNTERIAGGSSGGSGAAVAAEMCLGALGTDTAASIRHPAAYCGITGLKATYGRVSTRGVVPLSWSLDHVGPLCRSARGAALLLEAIAGYDALDPASSAQPVEHWSQTIDQPVARLRLGCVRHPYFDGLDPGIGEAVEAAMAVLNDLTLGLRETELPYNNLLMTIASAEAYAFHRSNFTAMPDRYQPMTRERLALSAGISAADYLAAHRELLALRMRASEWFREVDLVVTPTTALAPIAIAEGHLDPPLPANGTPIEFRNTHMFDVLGLPAISIPCGFTPAGMPVGLQIAGPPFAESRVLALARAYQQATDWHRCRPGLATRALPRTQAKARRDADDGLAR